MMGQTYESGYKMFLNIRAAIDMPINLADQYSHNLFKTPETCAGAKEQAGFIEAPDINAKKNISSPAVPLIAIPLNPFSPLV